MKNYLESFCRQVVRPECPILALVITASIVLLMGNRAITHFQPHE